MTKLRVLFCDDSGGVLKGFEKNVGKALNDMIDYVTVSSVAGVEAMVDEGEEFDVVITDLNFEKVGGGPKDGLEVLRLAKENWPSVEPILMTAYEGSLGVRDGLRLQTYGVDEGSLFAKTDAEDPGVTWLRLRERVQGIARRTQTDDERIADLRRENRHLREAVSEDTVAWVASRDIDQAARELRDDPSVWLEDQIGKSYPMQEVFRRIRRAAPLPSDVLILGPTGTGKELVARAIHKLSNRADKPFVKADLTTTSANLVESELFGHEKGAFTGADAKKDGLLKSAERGTFFLDEIGNISLDIQAKLLRVLEDRVYRAVGSTKDVDVDLRFLAATNLDLSRASSDETFRADLYERLNVVRIVLPPLSMRAEDIPLLVATFLASYRERFGAPGLNRIDEAALRLLVDYEWPRNIRQLKHSMERLFAEVDHDQEVIDRDAIGRVLEEPRAASPTKVTQSTDVFRSILKGDLSETLPDLKKRFGEDVTRDVIRRTMIHFRGLPDADECGRYFGGSKPNAWRQFAFQLGLTWRKVKDSLGAS